MSVISSNSNTLYTQANTQTSNTQGVHHHHHHQVSQPQDSVQLGKQDSQSSGSSTGDSSSILNSLVANGTITQSQESSIQGAFQSALQANSLGTYSSNGSTNTNPISSLVNSGTISQEQANSIQSAFKSAHHHVHQAQAADNSTQGGEDSLVQALESSTQSVNGSAQDSIDSLVQALDSSTQGASNN
ncbi:hypothetical protein SAMN02745134_03557 [Clostridium acidisoli DSM 12555]|uniref:Uncharacterized protein n=1 Tax=Clostridium acidisoli DSM 12555 TaxID=1121291 RepID=A0A1W1XXF7_9CLOT|nr:hypothetical protein [Clostridium acidisoli]SMC28537.1 hypothetical protein SAMN02745134_03557 [Clostridium acidisoli DSM 12555]